MDQENIKQTQNFGLMEEVNKKHSKDLPMRLLKTVKIHVNIYTAISYYMAK